MKIEFLGDSTQAGVSVWGGVASAVEFPPARLAGLMLGVEAVNLGVGGSTIRDALEKPIFPGGTLAQHVAQSDADLFVANWGINDAYLPGNTGAIHRQRWEAVRAICGNRLVVETPNPINVPHGSILTQLVAASRGMPVPYIDIHANILRWYPQWQAHMSDGIHPNEIMYLYIGKTLWASLKDMMP